MDRGIVEILFGQKIDYDLLNDTLFEFPVGTTTRCAITHPSIQFFNQLPLLVALQALMSALLAFPLYKLNVQITKKKNGVLSA
eukprot:scaffold14814_cov128-Skeletonema_dohrnii-CCMP3373.AAC.9